MNEKEWFTRVAYANFQGARRMYFSEIDKATYELAMENDPYAVDTGNVETYSRSDKTVLFSPSKADLARCTANVLFYEDFDCVPTSRRQIEEIIADMGLSPEDAREARVRYSERMEGLKANYCKPISEYEGTRKEVGLTLAMAPEATGAKEAN